jgi:N-acylneuraminate cytidylyltransferase
MNLAIIPARGGSKRIPGKNVKPFVGKPIIAYSIDAALQSGLFDKVIVSTDCPQIAKTATKYGAEVPFLRPAHLSDDFTGTMPVARHAIKYCIEHFFEPQYCCCIYATAPFLKAELLEKGLSSLSANPTYTFGFSATSFAFPVQRALQLADGGVLPMFPENIAKRSQDLEEAYHDAGQFYWGRTQAYLTAQPMFSKTSVPIILPRHLVQDIDTLEDWHRAELMYNAYIKDH